jgi:hypothetical protein
MALRVRLCLISMRRTASASPAYYGRINTQKQIMVTHAYQRCPPARKHGDCPSPFQHTCGLLKGVIVSNRERSYQQDLPWTVIAPMPSFRPCSMAFGVLNGPMGGGHAAELPTTLYTDHRACSSSLACILVNMLRKECRQVVRHQWSIRGKAQA